MKDAKEDTNALDALLAVDTDEEPRPGFDTRFHARLAELKSKKRKRGWVLGLTLLAGAVSAAVMIITPKESLRDEPALEIALEYDLLDDYEVVRDLPALEVLDLLAQADVPKNGEIIR